MSIHQSHSDHEHDIPEEMRGTAEVTPAVGLSSGSLTYLLYMFGLHLDADDSNLELTRCQSNVQFRANGIIRHQ